MADGQVSSTSRHIRSAEHQVYAAARWATAYIFVRGALTERGRGVKRVCIHAGLTIAMPTCAERIVDVMRALHFPISTKASYTCSQGALLIAYRTGTRP